MTIGNIDNSVHICSLTEDLVDPLPSWQTRKSEPIFLNQRRCVQLPTPGNQIHIGSLHEWGLVDNLVRDIAHENHRERKIGQEEILSTVARAGLLVSNRPDGCPELCDEYQNVQREPYPGSVHAGLGLEGQLIE